VRARISRARRAFRGTVAEHDLDRPLTRVLIEFAHMSGTDFPIETMLDELVARVVELLPVTGCGVMLMGADQELHFVAASNAAVLALEDLQNELIEGPCLEAFRTGMLVAVPDVDADRRFPRFSPQASAAGLAAVFTFPLQLGDRRLGALDLYRDVQGPLTDRELQTAQVLADIAAGYLAGAQTRVELRLASEELRHVALHDQVTGLPNRTLLLELLGRAAARARRSHGVATVFFIDLDDFKSVNDRHGHHVGDQLLRAVAERLARILRSGDTLARLGGDEFVALCEDMSGVEDAEIIAQRMLAVLASPFDLHGVRVTVTGSVGVAFSGPGEAIPEMLLRDADFAMYHAKRQGGAQHHVGGCDTRPSARCHVDLAKDLPKALMLEEFALAYQPIVEIATGAVAGVEALLRWHHPVRGLVMPNAFISGAERTGMIVPIGEWVLRQACEDLVGWERDARSPAQVAVNVSAEQVMHASFRATIARVLDETAIEPPALCLEITESLLLADTATALRVMTEIKDLGVSLSLDDFGTGYSSLSYLRQFPVDIVKVDRSFTANVAADPATRSIVRAVIDLSHVLGLTVVAEGVETAAQLAELTALGADYAQGYWFSRPRPKEELAEAAG
jgi:diguanylate cyclase (GGDEF)-like protein